MEYERIHQKVETGMISPSKLRMMLLRSQKKNESNSNSSRTSPSKLEDYNKFVKKSLLDSQNGDFDEEGLQVSNAERENGNMGLVKFPQFPKADGGNSSMVHPVKTLEEENVDYDSNASSSSFEFHKGDNNRSLHNHMSRSFQRQMPSKWDDAGKWIINKKNISKNQVNKLIATNNNNKVDEVKQIGSEKFSFISFGSRSICNQASGVNALIDSCPRSKDLQQVDDVELSSSSENQSENLTGVKSVVMRDMGTEMTPIASQEPSRTGTPVGPTTPLRSPISSGPSTPKHAVNNELYFTETADKTLSEEDLRLKTRREIVDLGIKLGKTNVASWASKDDNEKTLDNTDERDRIEFERRAAAWEEVEKSRHAARYKCEEFKIQAWESQQRAKLEAEMRKLEAQAEQMRAQAQAKLAKKTSMARQRSEERRAAAEAKMNEEAKRTAAKTEYIRQTGQIPSSRLLCCGLFA